MNEPQLKSSPLPPGGLTEGEWKEWKEIPATKFFFAYLRAKQQEMREAWEAGAFTGPGHFETVQRNSLAIGRAQCIKEIFDVDHVVINEELPHG